jgi:hypothetical protein
MRGGSLAVVGIRMSCRGRPSRLPRRGEFVRPGRRLFSCCFCSSYRRQSGKMLSEVVLAWRDVAIRSCALLSVR